MSLSTFAAHTFGTASFASVSFNGTGGAVTPTTITPVAQVILASRLYELTLAARVYVLTLVARTPFLILPARNFDIILPPRGQGGTVALSLGKQPAESFIYRVLAEAYLPAGRAIDTVQLFASRKNTILSATITSEALADATTLIMSANPQKGARLTINQVGGTAELVKVSDVSGTGPYTVTVLPALMFLHSAGETVDYEPGFSQGLLVSTAPAVDPDIIYPQVTRGVHGHTYRISMVMTLDDSTVIEAENDLVVNDE